MKTLNLIDFPLDGLALIEASAGTGKTYALANLYLRYLLEKQFTVEQILVVTFTEAATQELKDRIRSRIKELGDVFDGLETTDEVLRTLFTWSSNQGNFDADRLRLKIAERQMDQAEIHTIHGFCQQLLRNHALDSKSPLKQSLLEDQKPLLKQVIEDFWRQQVLALPEGELAYVCANWSSPESLLQAIMPLLNRSPELLIPALLERNRDGDSEGGVSAWRECYQESLTWFETLKDTSLTVINELDELIAKSDLKRLKDKQNWLHKIRLWCEQERVDFTFPKVGNRKNLFLDFLPENLLVQTKAKGSPPEHEFFDFLARHLDNEPVPLKAQFIVQTYQQVNDMLAQLKSAQRVLGFDDLILNVSKALQSDAALNDPSNRVFTRTVRDRYRVALIDEFQDTDQTQYHIFSTLFGVGNEASNKGRVVNDGEEYDQGSAIEPARLVLIGDPKQAIYSFRGGDIATYLKAKSEISAHPNGAIFTMDTNWRSSPQMVAAVNALFSGLADPFRAKDIPFQEVNAAKASSNVLPDAALYITQLDATDINKDQMSSALADHSVQQILSLLHGFDSASLFKNSDIAILVRSGAEGELMKQRLSNAGVSASFEGKSSIFESQEAQAIYFLLQAVADPKNEFSLRRCLAEMIYGVSDVEYRQLNDQTEVLSDYLHIFETLHNRWLNSGVLAMIRDALRLLNVYSHWQSQDFHLGSSHLDSASANSSSIKNYERSLSNINQLAELLQIQSRTYRGHFALTRWLRDSISSANSADDESKLRLESDEQLIRIVTIHKSKGLEYPFVFIPFLFSGRGANEAWFYTYKESGDQKDTQGYLTLDLLKDTANLERADDERLAEDVRLLYVALTRAKYQCYVGTTAYKGQGKIALGLTKTAWAYLLFQGEPPKPLNDEILKDCLEGFQQRFSDIISVQSLSIDDISPPAKLVVKAVEESVPDKPNFHAQTLNHRIASDWRVQSFTGLMHESHAQQGQTLQHTVSPALDDAISVFGFPKGSRAGTFLHTLFESVRFESVQSGSLELLAQLQNQYDSLEAFIHAKLSLSKLVDEDLLDSWASYLKTWMANVLTFQLGENTRLSDLGEKDYISEMEFHFPIQQLQSHRFNTLLKRFNPDVGNLDFRTFEGHLKGAIDLVFKANEQYFILDYKSNYLGNTIEDYQEDALHAVMEEHRYDVQYLLYVLATHRYLKHRLGGGYDYERDFGGVYYLFLRGLALDAVDTEALNHNLKKAKTGIVFIKPAFKLIDALDREVAGL